MTTTHHTARPHIERAGVPADQKSARLLGLYGQRQEGLMMQRVKVLGGRVTLAQWRRLAVLAARLSPGSPLRVTTRQNIEFHGVRVEDVQALQEGLEEVGLADVGACGDTVRAVTLSPENGLTPGDYDLGPLAVAIHAHAQSLPEAFSLPRKFKISLSGPEGGARPYINDLGFVANGDGTFCAILAGSLGAAPAPGIVCYERLALKEILPLVTAGLRLFFAEGDRQNRARARMRHVRERLGDAVFRQRLDNLFQEELQRPHPAPPALERVDGPARPVLRLGIPRGEMTPEQVNALVDALEPRGGALRIGLAHDLIVYGIGRAELPETLQAWIGAPQVIGCPGAHFCMKGVTETYGASDQLRQALPAGCGLLAAVSGCPNNCSQAGVADIGLTGRLKSVNGEQQTHYHFRAGGGHGNTTDLAGELHPAVPVEKVGAAAAWLVGEWRKASPDGAVKFGDFVRAEQERLARGMAGLV